jgi:arylsulfatase A-like enzyme
LAASGESAAAPPGKRRPSIIFIMPDDLGYADLSRTGSH